MVIASSFTIVQYFVVLSLCYYCLLSVQFGMYEVLFVLQCFAHVISHC